MAKLPFLLCCFFIAPWAWAASADSDISPEVSIDIATPTKRSVKTENTEAEPSPFKYTLGLKLRTPDLGYPRQDLKLLPVLGLRYGRLRIGTDADPESWLGFNAVRREPTLAFEAKNSGKWRVVAGLRVYNLRSGESLNAFEAGRHTLRARLQTTYAPNSRWSLGAEVTQDLLNKGDGTTLAIGAARTWRPGEKDQLSVGISSTWANGQHWRRPYANANPALTPAQLAMAQNLNAGVGGIGAGMTYRRVLAPQWVIVSSVSAGRSLGQLQKLKGSRTVFGFQTALMWFDQR